jgi:cytidyltransferase-like protein
LTNRTGTRKKVFVSGCFDMLHSGHVAFFRQAAHYGELHVALGSDANVFKLKGRPPVNTEQERLYMVKAVAEVHDAFISSGFGLLDFEQELRALRPDIFVVNADGSTPGKEALCNELGIEYIVLERTPEAGLPGRSTTALRQIDLMPYRIDLAGGWLDQPFVSSLYPGPVITCSIEPTIAFNERSGMATSTRNAALDLWGVKLPAGNPEKLAKVLFCYDNPPGTTRISGSQDAIGIVIPGLNCAHYEGGYWPARIDHIGDEETLRFIEESLYLVPLGQREDDYDPLQEQHLTVDRAQSLAEAAQACWQAIQRKDRSALGAAMRAAFEAQVALFPNMLTDTMRTLIARYRNQVSGWKISGAGGGGYMIFVADAPIPKTIRVNIRRTLE